MNSSVIKNSESQGSSFLTFSDSNLVTLEHLELTNLTGSIQDNKHVIYLNLSPLAKFILNNSHFYRNLLIRTSAITLKKSIQTFSVTNNLFENETMSMNSNYFKI